MPLPTVLAAGPREAECVLHLEGLDDVAVETHGLEEMPSTPSQRTFRYRDAPAALLLSGRKTLEPPSIDRASLTTSVEPEGRLLHHLQVEVKNWRVPTFRVRLPAGVRCLAAKAGGRWIDRLAPLEGGGTLELPVPSGTEAQSFEVVYDSSVPAWSWWASLEAAPPELPLPPTELRHAWRLPPGILPLVGRNWRSASSESTGLVAVGSTEWAPTAVVVRAEKLIVFRRDALPVLTAALAALACWGAWLGRRSLRQLGLAIVLAWLAAGGLLFWLPQELHGLVWLPVLTASIVALFAWLRSAFVSRRRPMTKAALILAPGLVFLPGLLGQEAAPPFTVFYVQGPAGVAEKSQVLASPELLKRLADLAQRGVKGLRQAVLLSAQYDGTVNGAGADFQVAFRVHNFAEENAVLTLPLGGVQLKDAFCDGVPAHPAALRPPREGYTLEIKSGAHVVILHFHVPVQANGEDRALRFSIPELVQSRLNLDVPAGARFLNALSRRGRQAVAPDPATNAPTDKPLRLETDLGRTGAVQVRWQREEQGARAANVQVREAYLWKVHPSASSLSAVLQLTVNQGATSAFALQVPEPLEVRSIETARLPGVETDEPAPRLKTWRMEKGNPRRLQLEFQQPISEGVQLTLELVPRSPWDASAVLPLPVPLNGHPTESLLAYRVEGLRVLEVEHLRINGVDAKAFAKFWEASGMNDSLVNAHAYAFQRAAGAAPFLRLRLAAPERSVDCRQQVSWHVGPRQADLTIAARISSPNHDLFLIEWEVPASIRDIELTGADVRSWSRTDSRLQVWLKHPQAATELKLTGWQPLGELKGQKGKSSPPWQGGDRGGSPAASLVFHLPPVGVIAARPQTTFVQINAGGGVTLVPASLKNLWPLPDLRPSNRQWNYVTEQADFGGLFQVARSGS